MKKIIMSLWVISLVFGMVGMANATLLDFESFANSGTFFDFYASPFEIDGYRFVGNEVGDDYLIHQTESSHFAGSTALAPFGNETHTLSRIDGQAFSLMSLDYAETWNDFGSGTVTFVGNLMGGGSVTQDIINDGVFGFEHVAFSGFENLLSVTFFYGFGIDDVRFQLDNISLESSPVVPEPATMLLFGTGLIGLFGLGRKKFIKK